jgi:hypothetical protein
VVGKLAKIFPPKVGPEFLSSSHHIASIHSAVINYLSTCPQTRTRILNNKTQLLSTTAYPPHRRTGNSIFRAAQSQCCSSISTPFRNWPVDLDSPILPRKPSSTTPSTKPSSSQRIHLRYMYLTPNANDLRHQPPLELQPFRIPRKPCSPYFSSNG